MPIDSIPIDPKRRSLSEADRKTLLERRSLAVNYGLHYNNPRFPMLSFMYAVYGGGEHTLYCDHTEEFAYEYLYRPFGVTPEEFESRGLRGLSDRLPDYLQPVLAKLGAIYARSHERTVYVQPLAEELDVFVKAVKHELQAEGRPDPVW
jgi:hypothetical protein